MLTRRVFSRRTIPLGSLVTAVLLALVLAVCLLAVLAWMPHWDWNSARTVLTVGWTHGFPLYSGWDDGAVQTTMYGPGKDLLILPASLATRPSFAIWIAGSITMASIIVPLLLLIWLHGRDESVPRDSSGASRERAVFAGLFALGGLLVAQSTRDMTDKIHVDAPAVGLALASCVVLMGSSVGSSVASSSGSCKLTVAAALAAFSVWTKQVQILLPVAQLAYLLWLNGFDTARRYFIRLATWGFGLLGLFVAIFGWEGMWLNLVVLPRDHPKYIDSESLLYGALELAVGCSFGFFLILLTLRADRTTPLRERAWLLPAMVAVALLPTSLYARLIAGGRHNSYHSIYFLLAAAALILARGDAFPHRPRLARRAVILAAVVAVLWAPWHLNWRALADPLDNPQEQAFEFALEHPGRAYFPWQPLSSLLAEGRLYHFDFHVHARRAAGQPLSQEHFDAYVPQDLRYVFFRPKARDHSVLGYLPDFQRTTRPHPDMPHWELWTQGGELESAPTDTSPD